MKRFIFVSTFILILSISGYAQHKPFLFGFRAAPNIGWMNPDPLGYVNEGSEVGFTWGFNAEFFLMENYAITTGFNVIYLNSKLSYPHVVDSVTGILNRNYRTKYIEIPLILKMKTREFGKARFYGEIGLGTSFLLSAKSKDKFEVKGAQPQNDEKDIKDEMKIGRESLILGVGVELALGGSTTLNLGIRFDNGFTDVLKDQNTADQDIDHQAINNFIEFNIGVLF